MSKTNEQQQRPSFKGLNWYREDYFSFFVPMDWQKVQPQAGRQGVIFIPPTDDMHTLYAVDVVDLGTKITSDDLPYLSTGFLDGIKNLPNRKIETKGEKVVGKQIHLEAKYTFEEDGETRKRWVRVFYDDTRQVTVTAQGKTVDAYEYWLPMFFEAMMTVKVHHAVPDSPLS